MKRVLCIDKVNIPASLCLFALSVCILLRFDDVILKIHSSMYVAVLIAVLIRPAHNEMYLFWVSHAILCTFLLLEHPLNFWHETRLIMAPTMLFTYVTYSLLPVRLQQAIIAGFILSASQLIIELLDKRSSRESESVSCQLSIRKSCFENCNCETKPYSKLKKTVFYELYLLCTITSEC